VLDLAKRLDEPLIELRAFMRLVFDHFELGDLVGVDTYRRAYDDCVARLRLPRARWQSSMFRAMLALLQGRMAEHDEAVAEAQRLVDEHGEWLWEAATRVGHSLLASWTRGDLETIERERLAFATFASIPNQSQYPELGAIVHLWLGEEAAARAILTREPVGKMVVDHHLPGSAMWAAELA